MELKDQILRTLKYMSEEEQKKMTINYTPKPEETALLVIDVQKEFCDPRAGRGNQRTKRISEQISSIIPEFRKAGIPVYIVYSNRNAYKPHTEAERGLYKIAVLEGDTLVAKERDSAFAGGPLKDILERDNRKLLLTCGFNLSACVYETVMDARKHGFDVAVMRDLTENDTPNQHSEYWKLVKKMAKKGVCFPSADETLKALPPRP